MKRHSKILTCLALGFILPGALAKENSKSPPIAEPESLVFKPTVVYPYAARRDLKTGSGILVVDLNSATGEVITVRMGKSTGHAILDNAAIEAFRKARFARGTAGRVKIPIAFTLEGGGQVSYERKSRSMDDVLARFLGKGTVLKGPIPEYPHFREWAFKEGKGVYELHADKEGKVDRVRIVKSSGDVIFDQQAVKTLGKWRLGRGPLLLELPLVFTLTPTSYSVNVAR